MKYILLVLFTIFSVVLSAQVYDDGIQQSEGKFGTTHTDIVRALDSGIVSIYEDVYFDSTLKLGYADALSSRSDSHMVLLRYPGDSVIKQMYVLNFADSLTNIYDTTYVQTVDTFFIGYRCDTVYESAWVISGDSIFVDTCGSTGAPGVGYWGRQYGHMYPLVITDSVGIGTNSPSENFEVSGIARVSGQLGINTTPYSGRAVDITQLGDANTHVYISNDSSDRIAKLYVSSEGVTNHAIYLEAYGLDNTEAILGTVSKSAVANVIESNSKGMAILTGGNHPLWFGTNNEKRMSINGSGILNIDTLEKKVYTARYKPVVWDTVTGSVYRIDTITGGSALLYWTSTGDSLYPIELGKNVGIGTSSAIEKLTVVGNINFSQTLATGDSGLVKQHGETILHTYSDDATQPNIFFGLNSGNLTTTGNFNSGFGEHTLAALTTGRKNIAIGGDVLDALTTGSYNTGVGYQALSENTTGNNNTGIGLNALDINTSGSFNTALGANTMFSATTGSFNTSIGDQSLYSLTTGGYNTIVGHKAGFLTTTGSNNVFLGYRAGYSYTGNNALFISNADDGGTYAYTWLYGGSDYEIYSPEGMRIDNGADDAGLGINLDARNNRSLDIKQQGNTNTTVDIWNDSSDRVAELHISNTHTQNHGIYFKSYGLTNTESFLGMTSRSRIANYIESNSTGMAIAAGGNNPLWFGTNDTVRMRIGQNGNIGIDTLKEVTYAERYKAVVWDTVTEVLFRLDTLPGGGTASYWELSGDSLYPISYGSRNVGIGTNVATEALTVKGNIDLTRTVASGDSGLIKRNGEIIFHTYADREDWDNYFLGHEAGNLTLTGNFNIGIGQQAGYSLTTTNGNILIGKEAGEYLSTGDGSNVFIGYQTGKNVTSGQYNVAIGGDAHNYNEGHENTSVGRGSFSATSGFAVGNASFGYGSGQNITNGFYNVAIGARALDEVTTGKSNVALGRYAGGDLETGDSNVFIGNQAGRSYTGDKALFIGNGTDFGTYEKTWIYGNESHDVFIKQGDFTADSNIYFPGIAEVQTGKQLFYNESSGLVTYGDSTYGGGTGTNYWDYVEALDPLSDTLMNNIALGDTGVIFLKSSVFTDRVLESETNTLFGIETQSPFSHGSGEEGWNNAHFGYKAGENTTTGNNNSFFGYNAGMETTTGSLNTFVGSQAGDRMVGGVGNVSVGYNSLSVGAAGNLGSYNVGIGNDAGSMNGYDPIQNVFIGYNSGAASMGGSDLDHRSTDNVFIGYNSGSLTAQNSNSYARYNVLIGSQAGYRLAGGSGETAINNIGIGSFAIASDNIGENTNGNYNIAVGNNTLQNGTDADYNIVIGDSVGFNLTTGDNNIIIGHGSGLDLLTSDSNIIIGHVLDIQQTNVSQKIYIGRTAEEGTDTIPLIYGDQLNDYVNINGNFSVNDTNHFDEPSSTLDVNGSQAWQSIHTKDGNLDMADGTNEVGTVVYIDADATNDTIFLPDYDTREHRVYWIGNTDLVYSCYVAPQSGDEINGVADNVVEIEPGRLASAHNSGDDQYEWVVFVDGGSNPAKSRSNESLGELYDQTDVISTATTGHYYTLTGGTSGQSISSTIDDSVITITQAGTYLVNFSCSFTHATNNTVIHICHFTNDVEDTNIETERKIGTGGDIGCVSGTGLVVLAANDVCKIKAKSTNTGNLTINHSNFNIIKIK